MKILLRAVSALVAIADGVFLYLVIQNVASDGPLRPWAVAALFAIAIAALLVAVALWVIPARHSRSAHPGSAGYSGAG